MRNSMFARLFGCLLYFLVAAQPVAAQSDTQPTVTDAMNTVFALAELKAPQYFTGGADTQFFENYVYRLYPATGIYLAFAGDNVFLLGGAFGEAIVDAGSISSVTTALEAMETPSVDSSGLWDLTISGTVTNTAFGVGTTVDFQGLVINDIPAPDLNNTDEINQEINASLEGVVSGISEIVISVENNSDTQRTFTVTFNAVSPTPGVTISYNLTYNYVR